ncbi:MAG TPA: HAMP domain-containing sensor histidine kinase [Acidimicrobiales bacterium]|nr:HAMP domain-containing sensor histidine kinase [Acidimicrobiales bacterium]
MSRRRTHQKQTPPRALADPDATSDTLRSTCEEVLTLGDRQERLIEALLTLARSERGIERWEPFDLSEIAEKVVLSRGHETNGRGIRIDTNLSEAPATGDPSLVESLMVNLVDNAVRHNVVDGRVEVSTTTTTGRATVSVGNTGPIIPPEEIDRLFQPFQQLGNELIRQGEGHGIGLAVVNAIVSTHGATLTASARTAGGLDIVVTFPPR